MAVGAPSARKPGSGLEPCDHQVQLFVAELVHGLAAMAREVDPQFRQHLRRLLDRRRDRAGPAVLRLALVLHDPLARPAAAAPGPRIEPGLLIRDRRQQRRFDAVAQPVGQEDVPVRHTGRQPVDALLVEVGHDLGHQAPLAQPLAERADQVVVEALADVLLVVARQRVGIEIDLDDGVKVNYNLWDGRKDKAEIMQKEADYQALVEQLEKLRLAINLDIQEAELNHQQAVKRRSVTDKMAEVAQESAQLSRERFKEGVILSSDVLDTEVRLTDTLVRQSAARANHRIAIANLRRALGYQQYMTTTQELLEK